MRSKVPLAAGQRDAAMKTAKKMFREQSVCPWWLAWTFDNPLRRFVQDPAKIVGPHVREGMTVADIGCGMGYFSIAMAKMAGERGTVIAVDLQQQMLDLMLRRARRAGAGPQIRSVLAAEDDIGIGEPVDFVLLFWMVHEVKNIPRFFGQVFSLLNPGGSALYAEPRFHVSRMRFEEILDLARAAGFHVTSDGPVAFSRAALLSKKG